MKAVAAVHPDRQLTETIADYLAQISLSLRPASVYSARGNLHRFDAFLAAEHAEVAGAADIGRPHVESYKAWLAARPGRKGGRPTPNTIRANLGTCACSWSASSSGTGTTPRPGCRSSPATCPARTSRCRSSSTTRPSPCSCGRRAPRTGR